MFLYPALQRLNRQIFTLFWISSLIVGYTLWFFVQRSIGAADLRLEEHGSFVINFLLNPFTRFFAFSTAGLMGAVFAARVGVGPINRIHDWLQDRRLGFQVPPLRVREGDALEHLVELINNLIDKRRKPLP